MSYDLDLVDPVTEEVLVLDTPHHMRGGTYAVGGSHELSLNITYNYVKIFREVLGDEGIRSIYGLTGAESIIVLESAAEKLKDDKSKDYWEATEGNAKAAMLQLAALAKMRPDGVWKGD